MLMIFLVAMLLHLSWVAIIDKTMIYEPVGYRNLVMMIPGLAIVIAVWLHDSEITQVWFNVFAILSYIVGVFIIYLGPE